MITRLHIALSDGFTAVQEWVVRHTRGLAHQ